MSDITIVSACDRNYLWGAYLLAASVARFTPGVRMQHLQIGFTPEDTRLLTQFPNVRVLPLADNDPRNVANRKAEALLSADTDYVAWLDADCMIIGDVSQLLVPPNGEFQIRMREPWENAWVWRDHYEGDEPRGGIPRAVLQKWREDVGQLDAPQVNTTCVTNCFVLHRRHLPIVREWKSQIAKVIPPAYAGVVDRRSPAYFMTDESVLSSLLAFSKAAPPIGEMRLNRDPKAHVAHFGSNPKPWLRWRYGVWYCHRHVLDLLDWARATGYQTPPLPWSLERRNASRAWLLAAAEEGKVRARATAGKLLRLVGVKRK